MNSEHLRPGCAQPESSLPSAAVEFHEITNDDVMLETVWRWYGRDPTFDPYSSNSRGADDVTGHEWAHFAFFVNGKPRVGVSLEEKQPGGYEVHVASAPGCAPDLIREAIKFIGTAVFAGDAERVVAWIPVRHRAARRLAGKFLRFERAAVTEEESGPMQWHRLAISKKEWIDTYGRA